MQLLNIGDGIPAVDWIKEDKVIAGLIKEYKMLLTNNM